MRTDDQLDDDWPEVPLSQLLASMETGSRPRGGVKGIADGVPSLGGEHLDSDGGFNFSSMKFVPRDFYERMKRGRIAQGDVLIVKDGATTGKVAYVGTDFPYDTSVANEHLFICRSGAHTNGEYLFWFLFSREGQRRILEHFKGSAQGGIARQFADDTLVPVAPIEAQKKLAGLLGRTHTEARSAARHLTAAGRSIERFRQAVLAAACSGGLTADWRQHASQDDALGDGSVDTSKLPQVPASWCYQRMDSLNEPKAIIGYGIVLPGPQVPDGVPYVRQQDVAGGTVRAEGLGRTTPEIAEKHSRSALLEGDVLLCIIRNLRVAIVPPGLDGANITQGMVRIRPGERVVGRYLAAYLESPYAQRWMKDQYVGLAMPRINVADARAIPVALPPLEEQAEIVCRIDHLLGVAQTVEDQIEASSGRLARSSQAILAKAFRGELLVRNIVDDSRTAP